MDIKVEVQGIIDNNCYLISDGLNAYIIDPNSDGDSFVKQVNQLGLKLRGIYLTHFHLDHLLEFCRFFRFLYISLRWIMIS